MSGTSTRDSATKSVRTAKRFPNLKAERERSKLNRDGMTQRLRGRRVATVVVVDPATPNPHELAHSC